MPLRRLWSLLVAPVVAVCLALLTAGPAAAHTELENSTPAEGASLSAAPTTVSLTFGEAVTLPPDPIRVTGPDGAVWTVGKATVTGATVTAPVTATGPAGAYILSWQVRSDDGDTIKGVVRFTLAAAAAVTQAGPTPVAAPTPVAPAPPTATPPPAPAEQTGGVPGWVWTLVGIVVLGGAAGAVVARRSRRS